MPLALSLFFTVLIGITRVNYGRWSTLPGVLWATWCFSATLLFFLPDSLDLISADSFMAIVLPHIVMMFGLLPSWLLSAGYCRTNAADNKQSLATLVDGSNKSLIWSLFVIFWCAGFVGSVLQLRMTGAWAIADLSEIYEIRDLVVGKFFVVPSYQRALVAFAYPASVLGAVLYCLYAGYTLRGMLIFLPLMVLLMMSFASGGRGALLIGSSLIIWQIVAFSVASKRMAIKDPAIICLMLVVTGYCSLIFVIRAEVEGFNEIEAFVRYFSGPLLALGELLSSVDVDIIAFQADQFAIIREASNLLGGNVERTIDNNIAFVPFKTNVFSALGEHYLYFGYLGTLIFYFLLGLVFSSIQSIHRPFMIFGGGACFYTYSTFTIFADVSMFIVGWWLSVLTAALLSLMSGSGRSKLTDM